MLRLCKWYSEKIVPSTLFNCCRAQAFMSCLQTGPGVMLKVKQEIYGCGKQPIGSALQK
ncbi:hypothetical protein GGU45_002366 [Niabella hirudinis]